MLTHLKTSESTVRRSLIATSISILECLQMGKPTLKLTIFWSIGEGIRMYLMFDHSGQQIVIVTTILWWQKYNETVHRLFIDFKKAYDSVRREVLHNILIEFGVPIKLVRLFKMCLNKKHIVKSV
jgi:hypothetical protein